MTTQLLSAAREVIKGCDSLSRIDRSSPCVMALRAAVRSAEQVESDAEFLASIGNPALTPVQLKIVRFVLVYIGENGFSPTIQEIADATGTSKVTAFEHLGQIERKGVIRRDKFKARSIRIIEGGAKLAGGIR